METNDAISKLLAAGIRVRPVGPRTLSTTDNELIIVQRPSKPPTSATVQRDLDRTDGTVMYLVNRIPASLEYMAKTDARVAVISPETVWFKSKRIQNDRNPRQARILKEKGPPPYSRFAVARALLAPKTRTQTELAEAVGITQPAVSNALNRLGGLVTRSSDGWRPTERASLLRWATDRYPGAGGITTYWWHDSPLEQQAETIINAAAPRTAARGRGGEATLLSGDLAARRVSAWRVPEHAVIYSRQALDPSVHGFSHASPDEYTLELTMPADRTIWHTAVMFGRPGIADPVIIARDIKRTGTTGDQDEAAGAVTRELLRYDN